MTNSEIKTENAENVALYNFGEFCLDLKRNILTQNGKQIALAYKALQTLIILVENQGRIVEKEEIIQRVWQDIFVEENSLTRNISVLRKVLGEEPTSNKFIETIPRRGYRFVAPVVSTVKVPDTETVNKKVESTISRALANDLNDLIDTQHEQLNKFGEKDSPILLTPRINDINNQSGECDIKENASSIWQRKRNLIFLLSIVISAAGITILAWRTLTGPTRSGISPSRNLNVAATNFTNSGNILDAVISSDGKYVVFVVNEGAKQSLWVRQTAAGSPVQILPAAEVSFQGIAFSPDGNFIFFNVWDRQGVGEIYRISTLGGMATKVVHDCMPSIAVSPNGRQIAFIRGYAVQNEQALIIANADGSDENPILRLNSEKWFQSPAWSPDGEKLAVALGQNFYRDKSYLQILEIVVKNGEQKVLINKQWLGIGGITWMPNQSGLIVNGADESQKNLQIWHIALPGGESEQITSDAHGYGGEISITADGSTIVAMQNDRNHNLWVAPSKNIEEAKKITEGRYEGGEAAWTTEGKIVYTSLVGANPDIWIMDADGSNKKQLTGENSIDFAPVVSPVDGSIFFLSNKTGSFQIWRMDQEGKNLKQMTENFGGYGQSVSPDGKWLIYISLTPEGKSTVWKLSTTGGEAQQLTKFNSYRPSVSPDGKLIAYSYWDEDSNPQQWGREIISLEDGHHVKSFNLPATANFYDGAVRLSWLPNQNGLAYIDYRDKVSNIWVHPLDDKKPPYQLTNYQDGQIFWFDWSRDGKKILISRGSELSDVVLLKIF